MRNQFAYAKTKAQTSAFVFATQIVQFLFFLNPKIQESCLLLRLYRSVVSDLVGTPNCWFSHAKAQILRFPCG